MQFTSAIDYIGKKVQTIQVFPLFEK